MRRTIEKSLVTAALLLTIGCGASNPSDSGSDGEGIAAGIGYGTATRYLAAIAGTGPTHAGVTSADFNADGFPDIAVTDSVASSVSILLNQGDGTLGSASRYLAGLLPYALVSADLNNDGIADLAVANSRSDDLSVLIGNGDGTFALPVNYPSGLGPTDIAAIDVNDDGHLDLLGYYGEISVHLNNGDGTFRSAPDAVVGEPSGSIAIAMEVADFNGDGRDDIAVTYWPPGASSSVITQLLAQENGQFLASEPSHAVSGSTEAMRSADVDCDGTLDLVTPLAGGGLLVQTGVPGEGLGEPQLYETDSGTNAVEFGDFNLDGKLDLAVSFFLGEVAFINDVCDAQWAFNSTVIATVETAEAMTSPDLDQDGYPDLVVSTWFSPQIAVHLNTGEPMP